MDSQLFSICTTYYCHISQDNWDFEWNSLLRPNKILKNFSRLNKTYYITSANITGTKTSRTQTGCSNICKKTLTLNTRIGIKFDKERPLWWNNWWWSQNPTITSDELGIFITTIINCNIIIGTSEFKFFQIYEKYSNI